MKKSTITERELKDIRKFASSLMSDVNDEKLMAAATTLLHLTDNFEYLGTEIEEIKAGDAKRRKVMELIMDMDLPYTPEIPIFIREALK